jgi:predicted NBD/HSP70 family sugar kinase
MPPTLVQIANSLLVEGEELRRNGTSLSRHYRKLKRASSSIAAATRGLGMSREDDPVRVLVTGDHQHEPAALAFGPSAGLVLGVSIGATSVRAGLVDANGWLHNEQQGAELLGQLDLPPEELFERIRLTCEPVLANALENRGLLVAGSLPFLGISVAWPAPLDTAKVPHGALTHPDWMSTGHGVHERLARYLHVREDRSHALNDAAAATLAVAFDHTRVPEYLTHSSPQQLIVVRLGGGIGASTIVVEPIGSEGASGWMSSRLTGGRRGLAGEIGHTPIDGAQLEALQSGRTEGCPPFKRVSCSCAQQGKQPAHIEAYAGGLALAARFAKRKEDPTRTLSRVRSDPQAPSHRRALEEAGMLLGDCLLPSVLMLSPHEIVLTGRLATFEVADGLEAHLENHEALGRIFGGAPNITALTGSENDFVRVRGAALAVLRRNVHRKVDHLFGAATKMVPSRFRELTEPLSALPWKTPRPRR